uniref:Uncharacterized protein n=1 Tax=Timema cristinae TaxID=61476 RepID=A0A7R9D3Y4_TIMCR|nr:unnamed protein product [Timema cristinae]
MELGDLTQKEPLSGKLVTQMFTLIRETIARNRDVLTCILIDEVESLTHIRQASESEPSDAIRVVNAVLTQIDQIRGYPNVLILTTSNLTGSIDGAFLDRADINQYIGPPTQTAIYQIFLSCLKELMKAKLINNECLFPVDLLKYPEAQSGLSLHLKQIAGQSVGLSGRTLRKIPLLAFTKCRQAPPLELKNFLDAMEAVILENKNLRNQNGPFEGSKEVELESS